MLARSKFVPRLECEDIQETLKRYKEFALVRLSQTGERRFSGAQVCAVRLFRLNSLKHEQQVKLVRDLLERARRDGI